MQPRTSLWNRHLIWSAVAVCPGAPSSSIRGQVDNFQQHLMYGRAYDKCIACSASVVEAYEKQGFDFVASVLNEPELLEELTGLKAGIGVA